MRSRFGVITAVFVFFMMFGSSAYAATCTLGIGTSCIAGESSPESGSSDTGSSGSTETSQPETSSSSQSQLSSSQPQPSPSPTPAPSSTPAPAPAPAPESIDSLEARLLNIVNADRSAAGLAPLARHPWAASVARSHSERMSAARGDVFHNYDYMGQGRSAMGANLLGENVVMSQTIEGAERAFMNSEGHRSNILNASFTHLGVGISTATFDSFTYVYVTQDFARISGSSSGSTAAKVCKVKKGKKGKKYCATVKAKKVKAAKKGAQKAKGRKAVSRKAKARRA